MDHKSLIYKGWCLSSKQRFWQHHQAIPEFLWSCNPQCVHFYMTSCNLIWYLKVPLGVATKLVIGLVRLESLKPGFVDSRFESWTPGFANPMKGYVWHKAGLCRSNFGRVFWIWMRQYFLDWKLLNILLFSGTIFSYFAPYLLWFSS